MFPPTHVLAGWTMGRYLWRKEKFVALACVCGSVAPDLSEMAQIAGNKIAGRGMLEGNSILNQVFTQIGHSIPIWGTALAILLCLKKDSPFLKGAKAFVLALLCHICLDLLTHKGKIAMGADYLAPWTFNLGLWTGIYTYRETGDLWPRWPEILFNFYLLGLIAWSYVPAWKRPAFRLFGVKADLKSDKT